MNFAQLLEDHGIETATDHHHSRPGWIQIDCPFCGAGSGGYHMGYNITSNYTNCWRCGSHSIVQTLMVLLGIGAKKAIELRDSLDAEDGRQFEKKPRGKLVLPDGIGGLLAPHKTYLHQERGFSPTKLTRLWGIQGIGLASRLSWRVFIPIIHQGEVVSWTTRALKDSGSRYIGAAPHEEAIDRRELLYGEDYCRHACIVHEGPTDVWAIGPGAVCTMGTGYSRAQLLRISKYALRIICFDREPEAQRRAKKLADDLCVFPGTTRNVVIDAKDAASATHKQRDRVRALLS